MIILFPTKDKLDNGRTYDNWTTGSIGSSFVSSIKL